MPLSPIERIRLDKAAVDEGFGLPRPNDADWLAYDSLGAPASIRLTCVARDYLVAVNHPGAAQDLAERWQKWPDENAPEAPVGFTAFVVSDTPKEIAVAWVKPVPVSVTVIPPLARHLSGVTPVTVGGP